MRDTIDMAREAGAVHIHMKPKEFAIVGNDSIKAFEALVRADERALAAPVQERKPVCWDGEEKCPNRQACCDAQHCLYTAPPAAQRQWVGLTDEEIDKTRFAIQTKAITQRDHELSRAIEDKLKEKNT